MPNDKTALVIAENIARYFGSTIEQGIGIVEDRLRYIRWERQIRLFDKASEILRSRGLESPTKTIPQKLMLPLIEAASLEENDGLQDKWAQLLANAADSTAEVNVERNFISILENMNEFEVELFDSLVKFELANQVEEKNKSINLALYPMLTVSSTENDRKQFAKIPHEIEVSLNNLLRLGILYNKTFGAEPIWVCVSALGHDFYKACTDFT